MLDLNVGRIVLREYYTGWGWGAVSIIVIVETAFVSRLTNSITRI